MDEKAADENLVELFQQWLAAFEAAQAACARKRPSPRRSTCGRRVGIAASQCALYRRVSDKAQTAWPRPKFCIGDGILGSGLRTRPGAFSHFGGQGKALATCSLLRTQSGLWQKPQVDAGLEGTSTRAKKEDALAEAKQVIYPIVLRAAEFYFDGKSPSAEAVALAV